ncbi:MAG: HRDC domain-containing protein [Planctomycetes bacterium]|nr:HRDC domain-containing protein [Planctomycetota bacterium]
MSIKLTNLQKKLISNLQNGLVICDRPYDIIADSLHCSTADVLTDIETLKKANVIKRLGPVLNHRALGLCSVLATACVPQDCIKAVSEAINSLSGVTHNYLRDHHYNLWFTLTAESYCEINSILKQLSSRFEIEFHSITAEKTFKLRVNFDPDDTEPLLCDHVKSIHQKTPQPLTKKQKETLSKLQPDLTLSPTPFAQFDLLQLRHLADAGIIKRFAAIVDHYKLGYTANTLFVCRVNPEKLTRAGKLLASFRSVSHCYQRTTFKAWPYNLYAMIHAKSSTKIDEIIQMFLAHGFADSYQLLPTVKNLKKGFQISLPCLDSEKCTNYTFVNDNESLTKLITLLKHTEKCAIDTEADSLHHYFEKVCLIQLSFDNKNFIIDPLADLDMTLFFKTLAEKQLIIHGADYDLRMLKSSFDFTPHQPVFDTMIAAQLCGYEKFGLAALIEKFFGITIDKKFQKADWSKRPFSDELLNYAAQDTHYLQLIQHKLLRQLQSLKRVDWFVQNCQKAVLATVSVRAPKKDKWRIKGTILLSQKQLSIVHSIWSWREKIARSKDLPPFRVMVNSLIIELSIWASRRKTVTLNNGPKLPRNLNNRSIISLEKAINKAISAEPYQFPQPAMKKSQSRLLPQDKKFFDDIKKQCNLIAEELSLDPAILITRTDLLEVVKHKAKTANQLTRLTTLLPWQIDLLLPVLQKALAKE